MNEWFHIDQVSDDTFILQEYRHWEQNNCYLLLGASRALLIDTGLGVSDLRSVVAGLTTLPVQVVTTHVHWDHIGGHAQFNDIAVFAAEQSWLSGGFPLPRSVVLANLLREPCALPDAFVPDNYQIYQGGANTILHHGDSIDLGGRRLQVLHTPGHSPGHICLYEAARQSLFTGDLVYAGRLDAHFPSTNPRQFHQSIKKIRKLPLRFLFPGHNTRFIPVSLIAKIDRAFDQLKATHALCHIGKTFDFGPFQIQL